MMKKILVFLLCLLGTAPWAAASVPEGVYFRAMQDEMNRTKKQLRVEGSAKPFFIAYRVEKTEGQTFAASLGQSYPHIKAPVAQLQAAVYIYAGDDKRNSSGFKDDYFAYFPMQQFGVGDSYEALRQALWKLTDIEYLKASNVAEKKEAYRRQKNLPDELPDFSFAPKGAYAEEVKPFCEADGAYYQALARRLSAEGKKLPYLEQYNVSVQLRQTDTYFLDSLGDYYQTSVPLRRVTFSARLRNKAGYKEGLSDAVLLPASDAASDEKILLEASADFLNRVRGVYEAKKAEPYLGPVLLKPQAAGRFFEDLFNRNARYSKPLLSAQSETDGTAGQFKDKTGMRVMSRLFDVYDRPGLKEYKGKRLTGFTPVDDEGVASEELHLVEAGKLKTLPTARSPIEGQKHSNGHARQTSWIYPRASLTNVFFEPKDALGEDELEARLLSRCRELELEYCYIFTRFPSVKGSRTGETNAATRIYTSDGRKEPAFGVRLEGVTPRSLRDILAAGNDADVSYFSDAETGLETSVVAPSVIVDEMEITPAQRKPDRKPFVPLP